MPEPLTFILGVASTVLSNVIADLVTGRTKAARKKEIEQQVAAILLEQSQRESRDLRALLQRVMDEVDLLSVRDPDLVITPDTIRLTKPPRSPLLRKQKSINRQLAERLTNLNDAVLERRRQLGLPTQESEVQPAPLQAEADSLPPGWVQAVVEQRSSPWVQELKDMRERIHKRRAGEEDVNE